MSILIKGMEMPKSCFRCPLRNNICYEKEKVIRDSMGRRLTVYELEKIARILEDCPLVEIPSKHGDLIDRDSLQKQSHVIEEYHPELQRQGVPKKVIYIEDVVKAPTIIESEG